MKVHHIGIACQNIDEKLEVLLNLGFHIIQDLVTDSFMNLDNIFIKNETSTFELIGKSNNKYKSDIDNILKNSQLDSDSIYHTCYECCDILEG